MAGIAIKRKRKRVEPLFHSDINLRPSFRQTRQSSSFLNYEHPRGHSHIKVTGMLVGKLKLNPMGNQCGCVPSLNWPLEETILQQTPHHFLYNSFCTALSDTWMGKYSDFPSQRSYGGNNLQFTPLGETTSMPVTFIWESVPRVKILSKLLKLNDFAYSLNFLCRLLTQGKRKSTWRGKMFITQHCFFIMALGWVERWKHFWLVIQESCREAHIS